MVAASEDIELFCYIIGDEPSNVFPIQIKRDRSIGNLKAKIMYKSKHTLQNIDAKALVLWEVSDMQRSALVKYLIFSRWMNRWTVRMRIISNPLCRKMIATSFRNWCHGSLSRLIGRHNPPTL
jgi:hypothetical protein